MGPIKGFDTTGFPVTFAAEVKNFDPLNFVEKKEARKMGRFIHFAFAATQEAMGQSGLKITPEISERVGVFIGSGIGGFEIIEREHANLLAGGPRKISPFFIPAAIVNMAAGQLSIRYGATGPISATATACATSANSIGDSVRMIMHGDADVMIAGGAEAAVTSLSVGGFAAMRALSTRNDEPTKASRPFDRDRDGFVIGEGAGILILEELEFARARGAKILAEVIGYGMSADAYHITGIAPEGLGAQRSMRAALKDAGIAPEEVGYVNAHATATPAKRYCCAHQFNARAFGGGGGGAWRQASACWRWSISSFRPPPTWKMSIPSAGWTTWPTTLFRTASTLRCRIHLDSAASMRRLLCDAGRSDRFSGQSRSQLKANAQPTLNSTKTAHHPKTAM
jgi:3-oxoacyl-(acyl-carrier-protein) synthase